MRERHCFHSGSDDLRGVRGHRIQRERADRQPLALPDALPAPDHRPVFVIAHQNFAGRVEPQPGGDQIDRRGDVRGENEPLWNRAEERAAVHRGSFHNNGGILARRRSPSVRPRGAQRNSVARVNTGSGSGPNEPVFNIVTVGSRSDLADGPHANRVRYSVRASGFPPYSLRATGLTRRRSPRQSLGYILTIPLTA